MDIHLYQKLMLSTILLPVKDFFLLVFAVFALDKRLTSSTNLKKFTPSNFVMGRGNINGRKVVVGADDFTVRGGAADQNLILFDEAIIYNSSHLFGLFSVFNSDAIKEVKLYKGGIPSSYGGRLSSVLDVYQKDGNNQKLQANGGIGSISSRFLIEGPIQKNKSSFLLASRGSYAHLFLKLTDIENVAYFYDLNTKSNFQFCL